MAAILGEEMTATFDSARAYKSTDVDGTWVGDGRELALLDFIYNHPNIESFRGNPQKVLDAIDFFARSHTGLINIGEIKGGIVTKLIEKHKPDIILELGGYVGYSAIMFGNALRQAGGRQYWSVEKSPLFAAIATSLIDLAGLRETVRVIVGTGSEGIQRLYDNKLLPPQIAMTFFDHHKPSYTTDLKLCERLGLVGQGTLLVGDNMIWPGNPPYLEWVRADTAEKKRLDLESPEKGNPHLVYKSQGIKSFEMSGIEDAIEVTECLGTEA